MKNITLLLLQIFAFVFSLAFVFSMLNYLLGWHLGMKGQEVPGDPRAALLFLGIGLVCGAVVYLAGRKKPVAIQNSGPNA